MSRAGRWWVRGVVYFTLVALPLWFLWPALFPRQKSDLHLREEIRAVFAKAVAEGRVPDPPPSLEGVEIRSRHGGLPMTLGYHNAQGEFIIYGVTWERREKTLYWRFIIFSEPKQELILPRLSSAERQELPHR